MTTKRIAMISEHASPLAILGGVDSGGQNVYVGQLARHLAAQGHEVLGSALEPGELPEGVERVWSCDVRDPDRVEELTARDGIGELEAMVTGNGPAVEGDDRLIEELEIGVRAYNCLKRAGIQTVGDLVQRSESELNAIPNFGKRSTDEVIEALTQLGLSLRGE